LGLLDPLTALIVAFCFVGVMIYKRVNLGITLNAAALLLAFLALDLLQIGQVIYETSTNPLAISLVVASFGIMLLSLLYRETNLIDSLSESLSKLINNSKLIVSLLPAVIGLLPVAGGALMSAPLVESETEKLGLDEDKKTYVNLWFRHTIFPIYPVSQFLILTAVLAGVTLTSIIQRQLPIVVTMIVVGYFIGLRKTSKIKGTGVKANRNSELKRFAVAFSPILATIISLMLFGIDISIATFVGVAVLVLITRPKFASIVKSFRNQTMWGIVLAAYGAFLLRSVIETSGISVVFRSFLVDGSVNALVLLTLMPAVLSILTGSAVGGIALTLSILTGIVDFNPTNVSLIYVSSYMGYLGAPTHLCLVFTADYFRCPLRKLYRYLVPSLIVTFAVGILVYFLV
jgi:integral membrane protein (TIGR00529 family)